MQLQAGERSNLAIHSYPHLSDQHTSTSENTACSYSIKNSSNAEAKSDELGIVEFKKNKRTLKRTVFQSAFTNKQHANR